LISFDLPSGKKIPLVDEITSLFPSPTMAALDLRYSGAVGSAFEWMQNVALATWVIPVPVTMGRRPNVDVYVGGELVDTDITADSTQVTITFPSPTIGTAVLS
jgi:hypothetical protein